MIRETADELRTIAESCTDAAGYFPAMYSRVTTEIANSIDVQAFVGGDRMDVFATEFASRYTACVETGGPATEVLAGILGRCRRRESADRAAAPARHQRARELRPTAGGGRGRARTGDLASVREDFDTVNDVLASVSVGVLDDLDRLSHWTSMVAALGGGRAFNFSLRVACARAWDAAERLYALDEDQQRDYLAELDELVSVLAYLITRPPIPVAVFAFVARLLEQRDPKRVITGLLGTP